MANGVEGVKKFSELETGVFDKEHPAYIPYIQEQGLDNNNEELPILNRKLSLTHLPIFATKISNRVLGINETATDFELKEIPLKITGANGINVNNTDPKFPIIELGEAKQGGGHTVGERFLSDRIGDTLNGAYPADGREFLQTDFVQSQYDPYTLLVEGKLPSVSYEEYDAILEKHGTCPYFGLNLEEGKFRIPKLNPRILTYFKKATNTDSSWYNIYSDGWCEQGAKTNAISNDTKVNLLIDYVSNQYGLQLTTEDAATDRLQWIGTKYNNYFTIVLTGGVGTRRCNWVAEGYCDPTLVKLDNLRWFIQLSTDTTEVSIEDYTKQLDHYFDDNIKPEINNYLTDVSKKELDDYEKAKESEINNYVQDTSKVDIANYINNTSKPTLDNYVEDTSKVQINSFIENDSKPKINNYVLNTSFPQLKDETDNQIARVINQGNYEVDRVNLAGTANSLIGFPMFWLGEAEDIPDKFVVMLGQTVNIIDYPNLFTVFGNRYGGDGITTFVIPNLNDARFLEGNISLLGSSVNAGLPEISGSLINITTSYIESTSGAFTLSSYYETWTWGNNKGTGAHNVSLSASRSNNTYSSSVKTNQPKAIRGIWIVKYT